MSRSSIGPSLCIFVVASLLLVVSSCGDDPTKPETGSIAVSVRADGSGVPGVTVSLQGPASLIATTDGNGITTFQALGPGTYTVSISGYPDDHYFPKTSGSATLESGGSASVSFQGNRLEITTASLSRGMVGVEYSAQLEAAGGTGSYAWSLASGSLPEGLSLASSGEISGTPTTADSIACTFRVTSGGAETSRGLSVTVRRAAGTIEGVVYFDRDHDGMPSAGEGLAQLAVAFLPEDATEDGDTVSTGPDGAYSVVLAPGTYSVAFPSLPDSLRAPTAPTLQVLLGDTVTLHLDLVVVQDVDDFILSVSTLVLDSASASSIQISQDGATITLPTSTEGVGSLLPGDILVAGVTEATPVGLLRKVESVSTAGGQTTLSTLQATLEEAIFEGSFSVRQQLSPSDLVGFQAPEGVTLVEGAPALEFFVKLEQVLFDADGNHDTKHDQIRLDGEIRFVPTVILEGEFRRLRLRSAKAGMELDLDSDVGLTWAHRAEKTVELRIARFSFAPMFFGPFVFFPSIEIRVGVEGGVEATLKANLEYSASAVAAVELRDGTWHGISDWDDNVSGGLNPSLSASASAFLRVPVRFDLYGLAGPQAGVSTYLQGIVAPAADPWWELFFGATGQAGFEMKVFSWITAGIHMDLFQFRKLILDAGGPFNLPVVTIASPQDGAAYAGGEPIVFEGSAVTPVGWPLTGDALRWISDRDGELGTGRTFTRSDLSAGAHVITLEATDPFGAVGSASVQIEVETAAPPVSRWTQVEGTMTVRELYDVWTDGSIVIAVGGTDEPPWDPDEDGIVLRSTDGGDTWSEVSIPTTNPLQGVWGVGSTIIAVGWGGTVLRSTDRGATWTRVPTAVTAALRDVWGAGSTFVAVGASGTILRSTNGGVTWAAVESQLQSGLSGVSGVGSVLIAVGGSGTILRSADQGASWSAISIPTSDWLRAVAATSQAFIATSSLDRMYRSTDGGLSWEMVTAGGNGKGIFGGLWGSGSTFIAVGGSADNDLDIYQSVLLRSTDSGSNWSTVPLHPESRGPHGDLLRGVSGSGGAVFAVGTWGAIHRSVDAGGSWQPVTRGSTDYYFGVTGSGATVVAVGLGGSVRRSTDGGANWAAAANYAGGLCGIGHIDSTFIALGDRGTGLRSTDGGANWSPFTAELVLRDWKCGVWGSGSTIIAAGGRTILRSTDAGASWTTILTSPAGNLQGVWGIGSTVVAVDASGDIFRSEDGGATWSVGSTGTTGWLSHVWGSGETFIAVGSEGTIIRSNDSGLTWSKVPSGTTAWLGGVAGAGSTVIAVGEGGTILRSTDGGVSWVSLDSGVDHYLIGLWMPVRSRAVAVGSGGTILIGEPGALNREKATDRD